MKKIKSPEGYVLTKKEIPVEITKNNQILRLEMINKPIPEIEIPKTITTVINMIRSLLLCYSILCFT